MRVLSRRIFVTRQEKCGHGEQSVQNGVNYPASDGEISGIRQQGEDQ
jgi:hypothetical protein